MYNILGDNCAKIEKNIKEMQSVTQLLSQGKSPEDIAMMALEGLNPNVLDDFEVSYKCDCTKERVERALISLGNDQLDELAEDAVTEVKCHFCDKVYHFSREEVKALKKC